MKYMTYKSHGMHDIYLISMKCIIYGSKYEVILEMLLLYNVPGRVGFEV